MAITIGAKPESSFREPLGLLGDCHRRIERFLDQLLRVAESAQGGALDDDRRTEWETALRYFERAAPLHTEDEEKSLFPRLRASADPRAREALRALAGLEEDHRTADADHAEVDRLGRVWLSEGSLSDEQTARLRVTLRCLRALYARHIAIEDNTVFPLAGAALRPEEIAAIGREMALRRGLDPDVSFPTGRCGHSTRREAFA